jgi:hypothetical protein
MATDANNNTTVDLEQLAASQKIAEIAKESSRVQVEPDVDDSPINPRREADFKSYLGFVTIDSVVGIHGLKIVLTKKNLVYTQIYSNRTLMMTMK